MKLIKEKELVGVKEIARRAKVSIATVDRVIHNRTGVSIKTKEKIEAIIKELNYQPNILARRLASKTILKFAVLIPEVSEQTAFWQDPLNGILQAEAEIRDYGIQIDKHFFDQNNINDFILKTELILKNHVDGILFAPMFIEASLEFAQACDKLNIPYVFINSDIPGQDSLCYIGPNLYHSGYLAAHIVKYLLHTDQRVLIVNIAKAMDNHHHLLRKEKGFRAYFDDNKIPNEIIKIDVQQTDYSSLGEYIANTLSVYKDIQVIFVTNSRVSTVAHFLEKIHRSDILLIGYDFLPDNVDCLKKGAIDFLICQKPQEQGYKGIISLYNHLVQKIIVEKVNFMPIDIITKENYMFYRN